MPDPVQQMKWMILIPKSINTSANLVSWYSVILQFSQPWISFHDSQPSKLQILQKSKLSWLRRYGWQVNCLCIPLSPFGGLAMLCSGRNIFELSPLYAHRSANRSQNYRLGTWVTTIYQKKTNSKVTLPFYLSW